MHVRPLARDELSMPSEQRVGGDDRRDVAHRLASQPVSPHGEPAPVVIGETQAPPTQLPPQEAILFDQIGERLPFSAIEPSGDGDEQQLETRDVDHEREVISRPAQWLS